MGVRGYLGRASRLELVVLLVVLVTVIGTAWLLSRVASAAGDINDRAVDIVHSARKINMSTDAVKRLHETNALADKIYQSTKPLDGELSKTVDLTTAVDNQVHAVNAAAGTIDDEAGDIRSEAAGIQGLAAAVLGTAKTIQTDAAGINKRAAEILDVAKRINVDVAQINLHLDTTIRLARAIRADTGNIADQAKVARHVSACINREAHGPLIEGYAYC